MTRISQNDGAAPDSSSNGTLPLVTIACHEDLTASDLVGRYLLQGEETIWIDGPLTRAVKAGGICYLDEIVEARKDTTVLIHPLTDHRRILPVEKKGELLEAADGFLLVMSYNPGYQSALKDLKHSTRQRFVAIEFDYPPKETRRHRAMNLGSTWRGDGPGQARRKGKTSRAVWRGAATPADLRREDDRRRHGAATRMRWRNWAVRTIMLQASVDEVINRFRECDGEHRASLRREWQMRRRKPFVLS